MVRLARFAFLAIAAVPSAASIQDVAGSEAFVLEESGLSLSFPTELAPTDERGELPLVRAWKGKVGACNVDVELLVIHVEEYELDEPEEANEVWRDHLRSPEGAYGARLRFGSGEALAGSYGWAEHAALLRGNVRDADTVEDGVYLLSGLLRDWAWTLRVLVEPTPSEADDKAIRALLLAAPKYEGPVRDPRWTDSEIRARWLRCAPEPTSKKLEPPVRTEHYIVLADCSNAAAFAKKLEGFHAALKKIVPIPDVPSCKLLPIYLFRTEDEYYDYYVKALRATRDEAEAQWGHREGIYYVTYFEDLDNPIHLYYAAQQILDERIGLDGGGSWFQAGLAEFASTKPTDRSPAAKKAKNGEHIPLAELIRLPDFGRTTAREETTGVDQVGLRFAEAALVFEFLHESKSLKQRFVPFMQAVGVVEDTDVPGIEAALREVYGTDVAGLEQQWLEYCKKR